MTFSEKLIQQAEPYWQRATEHIFITEMVEDTLDKQAFAYYLIQDYAFVRAFLDLVGHSIAYSETIVQKHRLSSFLSMVTSEENDYFIRAFDALGVSVATYLNPTASPAMQGFHNAIQNAITSGKNGNKKRGYQHCMTVLACAETVYHAWGIRHADKKPEAFYFNEWLILHNNDAFQQFVAWLRSEIDLFADLPTTEQDELAHIYRHVCQLEAEFFDESYSKSNH